MISALEIYLIGQIEEIKDLFEWCATAAIVILLVCLFIKGGITLICYDDLPSNETKDKLKILSSKFHIIFIMICIFIFQSFSYLIPTTKTLAAMYIVPAVVNDERIQGITNNTLNKLLMLTDDWVKDTLNAPLEEIENEDVKL